MKLDLEYKTQKIVGVTSSARTVGDIQLAAGRVKMGVTSSRDSTCALHQPGRRAGAMREKSWPRLAWQTQAAPPAPGTTAHLFAVMFVASVLPYPARAGYRPCVGSPSWQHCPDALGRRLLLVLLLLCFVCGGAQLTESAARGLVSRP